MGTVATHLSSSRRPPVVLLVTATSTPGKQTSSHGLGRGGSPLPANACPVASHTLYQRVTTGHLEHARDRTGSEGKDPPYSCRITRI